jgi:alpha-L-fucosidase
VGSNHHLPSFPGEDFQMFEKDLPGQKTTGFNSNFLLNTGPVPDGKIQPAL